jgi:hypothetical protein
MYRVRPATAAASIFRVFTAIRLSSSFDFTFLYNFS